jgi:hypothetical protein
VPAHTNGDRSSNWLYPVLGGGILLVMQGFWSVAYNSVTSEIARVDRSVAAQWQNVIGKESFKEYEHRINDALKNHEHRLDGIIEVYLPKERFEGRIKVEDQTLERLQKRLDDLDKDIHGTYSPKDAFSTLQGRIERLESFIRDQAAAKKN